MPDGYSQRACAALLLLSVASSAFGATATSTVATSCVSELGNPAVAGQFVTWTNPSQAQGLLNGLEAATDVNEGDRSYWLKCTGWGLDVPTGATINGITVTMRRRCSHISSGRCRDYHFRLIKGGVVGAAERATGTNWPGSFADEVHGGAADAWNESWTATEVNAANFGVAFIAYATTANYRTAIVAGFRIDVDYTPPTPTHTFTPTRTPTPTNTITPGGPTLTPTPTNTPTSTNSPTPPPITGDGCNGAPTSAGQIPCASVRLAADVTVDGPDPTLVATATLVGLAAGAQVVHAQASLMIEHAATAVNIAACTIQPFACLGGADAGRICDAANNDSCGGGGTCTGGKPTSCLTDSIGGSPLAENKACPFAFYDKQATIADNLAMSGTAFFRSDQYPGMAEGRPMTVGIWCEMATTGKAMKVKAGSTLIAYSNASFDGISTVNTGTGRVFLLDHDDSTSDSTWTYVAGLSASMTLHAFGESPSDYETIYVAGSGSFYTPSGAGRRTAEFQIVLCPGGSATCETPIIGPTGRVAMNAGEDYQSWAVSGMVSQTAGSTGTWTAGIRFRSPVTTSVRGAATLYLRSSRDWAMGTRYPFAGFASNAGLQPIPGSRTQVGATQDITVVPSNAVPGPVVMAGHATLVPCSSGGCTSGSGARGVRMSIDLRDVTVINIRDWINGANSAEYIHTHVAWAEYVAINPGHSVKLSLENVDGGSKQQDATEARLSGFSLVADPSFIPTPTVTNTPTPTNTRTHTPTRTYTPTISPINPRVPDLNGDGHVVVAVEGETRMRGFMAWFNSVFLDADTICEYGGAPTPTPKEGDYSTHLARRQETTDGLGCDGYRYRGDDAPPDFVLIHTAGVADLEAGRYATRAGTCHNPSQPDDQAACNIKKGQGPLYAPDVDVDLNARCVAGDDFGESCDWTAAFCAGDSSPTDREASICRANVWAAADGKQVTGCGGLCEQRMLAPSIFRNFTRQFNAVAERGARPIVVLSPLPGVGGCEDSDADVPRAGASCELGWVNSRARAYSFTNPYFPTCFVDLQRGFSVRYAGRPWRGLAGDGSPSPIQAEGACTCAVNADCGDGGTCDPTYGYCTAGPRSECTDDYHCRGSSNMLGVAPDPAWCIVESGQRVQAHYLRAALEGWQHNREPQLLGDGILDCAAGRFEEHEAFTPWPTPTNTPQAPTRTPTRTPTPTNTITPGGPTLTPTPTPKSDTPTWTVAPTMSEASTDCVFKDLHSDGTTRIYRQHGLRMRQCPGANCVGEWYWHGTHDVSFGERGDPNGDNLPLNTDPDGPILTIRVLNQTGFQGSADYRHAKTHEHTEGDKTRKSCTDPINQWAWAWYWVCQEELRLGNKTFCADCNTAQWTMYPNETPKGRHWAQFSCLLRDYVTPSIAALLEDLKTFESPLPQPVDLAAGQDGVHVSSQCAGAVINMFADGISRNYLTGPAGSRWQPCSTCDAIEFRPGISACDKEWFTGTVRNACLGHPGTAVGFPDPDISEFPFWKWQEWCRQEMKRYEAVANGWRIAHGQAPYPSFTPTPNPTPVP